jgi:hypothetical protein
MQRKERNIYFLVIRYNIIVAVLKRLDNLRRGLSKRSLTNLNDNDYRLFN